MSAYCVHKGDLMAMVNVNKELYRKSHLPHLCVSMHKSIELCSSPNAALYLCSLSNVALCI